MLMATTNKQAATRREARSANIVDINIFIALLFIMYIFAGGFCYACIASNA